VHDGTRADLRDDLDILVNELRKLVEGAAGDGCEPAAGESLARRDVGLLGDARSMRSSWRPRRLETVEPGTRPETFADAKEKNMPTVTSPVQLFEHELRDMYYAEQTLTKVLPKLAEEASDRELSRAFTSHLKETEGHVANLEKVFKTMGKTPQATPCPGIEGIKKEHDDFVQTSSPSAAMLDAFLTGAASRAEHYEIAAYTGLVSQARALKEREAVDLLQENLKQEKEALKKVETISKRLLKKASGNGRTARS
jgi:ferritin-like metal-binding protein YciE